MKKLGLLLVIPAFLALATGCKNSGANTSSGSGDSQTPSSSEIDKNMDVIVNFYIDYNNTHYKLRYYQTTVKNGSKITDVPATPTAPSEDFPVFKGWSTKEITDDYANDIWNFSTDVVAQDSNNPVLDFYGIWAAQ